MAGGQDIHFVDRHWIRERVRLGKIILFFWQHLYCNIIHLPSDLPTSILKIDS